MWKSESLPSTGVWSNLKSPVWTIVPTGVRSAIPIASGIECPIRNGTTVNGPMGTTSPGSSPISGLLWSLCSLILLPSRPRARVDA
jgi:hypothetical protein